MRKKAIKVTEYSDGYYQRISEAINRSRTESLFPGEKAIITEIFRHAKERWPEKNVQILVDPNEQDSYSRQDALLGLVVLDEIQKLERLDPAMVRSVIQVIEDKRDRGELPTKPNFDN